MIREESKGNQTIFELDDGTKNLGVTINPGKEDVAYFISPDYNFLEMVGEDSSREEAQEILEEELDLRTTGETQVAGIFEDEFSIVLLDGKLYAGERWSKEEKQLYPV